MTLKKPQFKQKKSMKLYTIDSPCSNPAGVREYWILDLRQSMITVHNFETGLVKIHGFEDKIPDYTKVKKSPPEYKNFRRGPLSFTTHLAPSANFNTAG